jgi:hypothetical protein
MPYTWDLPRPQNSPGGLPEALCVPLSRDSMGLRVVAEQPIL